MEYPSSELAIKAARRLAGKTGEAQWVVWECGAYHVANEFDLDTWFAGISDRNILYCTADD